SKLGNYSVTLNKGKQTITQAPLTVTPGNANRLYGDANPAFTGTITGIKNGDNITANYSTSATTGSPIGTYGITEALNDPTNKLGNYTVTLNSGTLTVNPAPLTVTPANASRLYGSANPAFTGAIVGIKNGDPITASYGTTATPGSRVGSYAINCSGQTSTNYAITYVPGTLTITYVTSGMCAGDVGHQIRQPINVDGSSVWRQGSTVPAKFAVCDANGVSI